MRSQTYQPAAALLSGPGWLSIFCLCALLCVCAACGGRGGAASEAGAGPDTLDAPRYATGYQVRDSGGVRLVDIGQRYHFALVEADDAPAPDGYTRVRVPISRTICMTALQLSNFTILGAHDVVKGLTGTKNLFNEDIRQRVSDGRIVKIGMEGNFDAEMVLAANPDVIFISPFKRGGYEAIKETGVTLVPHLGYKELHPLGQALPQFHQCPVQPFFRPVRNPQRVAQCAAYRQTLICRGLFPQDTGQGVFQPLPVPFHLPPVLPGIGNSQLRCLRRCCRPPVRRKIR